MEKVMLGDMLLRAKLSVFGKARYLHNIEPSVYRYHDTSMYSALPLAERMGLTFETRKYLIENIAADKQRKTSMTRSLSVKYLGYFFGMIKFEKKINWEFLKESKRYAKKSGSTLPSIFKQWFLDKINS